MKIVFRADASIEMGIGHVMRCLTLADALRERGAQCHFVCREHPGNLISQIVARGHQVCSLPLGQTETRLSEAENKLLQPAHARWLSCGWRRDARQTSSCVGSLDIDWLIVDHYALDERWEKQLRAHCRKIMVIDDLADRNHDCDLLLDQTFGRAEQDYHQRVPVNCKIFTGAKYALLRPEFSAFREYSLQRRAEPKLEHFFISMGGIDKDNVTDMVLRALCESPLPKDCRISVVLGGNAPWLKHVKAQATKLPWKVEVKSDVANMAQLMANSDLAIGAAGSTSWERCCLGLPSLMIILAENQQIIANGLEKCGAAINLGASPAPFLPAKIREALDGLSHDLSRLKKMSTLAFSLTEGRGAILIAEYLLSGV